MKRESLYFNWESFYKKYPKVVLAYWEFLFKEKIKEELVESDRYIHYKLFDLDKIELLAHIGTLTQFFLTYNIWINVGIREGSRFYVFIKVNEEYLFFHKLDNGKCEWQAANRLEGVVVLFDSLEDAYTLIVGDAFSIMQDTFINPQYYNKTLKNKQ